MNFIEVALLNGQRELTLPWYERAKYPMDLGHWHQLGDNHFRTKLPVIFPASPEAEFLDYRESASERQAFNGWCVYSTAYSTNPILYGAFDSHGLGVVMTKAVSVDFYLAFDLSQSAVQARSAAWAALFGMPMQQGHAPALASLCACAFEEMRRAPSALIHSVLS